jgi:hypothetical protein
MNFLDKFPKVPYDINKNSYSNFENVTDLTFRFSFIKSVLDNTSAYYEYAIKEDETPEILADRVYGDSESYWMILYANDRYDPQFDWPMNSDAFERYVVGKYGSIANSKMQIHHYEKIIARQVENSEKVYIERQVVDYSTIDLITCTIDDINEDRTAFVGQNILQKDENDTITFSGVISSISNNIIEISSPDGVILNDTYVYDDILLDEPIFRIVDNTQGNIISYTNLPRQPYYSTYTLNNKRVVESIARNAVSYYDHELEMNENKRLIKIIKKEYYGQIKKEFYNLTKTTSGYSRALV